MTPVWNERALFIDAEKILVIADLHIGIEFEYRKQGINIALQTDKLLEKCIKLIKESGAEILILLGDVKHMIIAKEEEDKEMLKIERKSVRKFLKILNEYAEVWIVRGNHDGRLKSKYAKIFGARGTSIGDIALAHGHSWTDEEIMDRKYIITAHIHPFVKISTEIGYSYMQPCWVKGKMKKEAFLKRYGSGNHKMKFIIMPPFNPLCGGIAVNEAKIKEGMVKIFDMDNAHVYLLNGVNLGRIKNLR